MEFCFSVGCHVLLTSTIVLQCVMSHDVHYLGSWQNELPWWMQSVSAGKLLGKNHGALLWRCEFGEGVRSVFFFRLDYCCLPQLPRDITSEHYMDPNTVSIQKKSLYNFASGPLPGVWLALLLCSLINVVSSAYRLWSNANWLIEEIHIWGLCQYAKHICLRKVELEAGKV